MTWHDVRHTGMTLAAATGASLVQLQRRLSQSTVRAALIYQHATDNADRLLADYGGVASRITFPVPDEPADDAAAAAVIEALQAESAA